MKICKVCKEEKELDLFYNKADTKDGKMFRCKVCDNLSGKKYRALNPEKTKQSSIRSNLKFKYGMTLEDRDDLIKKQGGVCAICCELKDRMVIDHCHSTGKIRGMLCNSCNRGLGYFGEDIQSLEEAITYIQVHGYYTNDQDEEV